jgi:hypothetical protein
LLIQVKQFLVQCNNTWNTHKIGEIKYQESSS